MSLTGKQQSGVFVYVGNYGTYEIPPELCQPDKPLKEGLSIFDMRTKHGKSIKQWAQNRDMIERAKHEPNR